jgi:TolB-like protein
VLSKADLMNAAWPATIVDDGSVIRTVSRLRAVLTGSSHIETVAGVGYRFVSQIRSIRAYGSLAILPFIPLTHDHPGTDFGIGMADVLITLLARSSKILVRPTSSVVRYIDWRGDAAAAGRELEVAAVLEGHIQFSPRRTRTTVQLIDVGHGWPSWGETFTVSRSELFALQDVIAAQIAAALQAELVLPGRG